MKHKLDKRINNLEKYRSSYIIDALLLAFNISYLSAFEHKVKSIIFIIFNKIK
jgi:hypothetical protein